MNLVNLAVQNILKVRVGLSRHGRILFASHLDLGLARTALVLGDGVHDHRDVGAATPPRRLLCYGSVHMAWVDWQSVKGMIGENSLQLSQVAFLHMITAEGFDACGVEGEEVNSLVVIVAEMNLFA